MTRPVLFLAGVGMGERQLTAESRQAIDRASRLFAVGISPASRRYLLSLRAKPVDLLLGDAPAGHAERYLDAAAAILDEAVARPPVTVLFPGNPLLSNALARFLVLRGRELDIDVRVLPAISPIDTAICELGLDVGSHGLQVFDARRLCARDIPVNPAVPLLILQVAGLAGGESSPGAGSAYRPLGDYLCRHYPGAHPLVHLGNSGTPSSPLASRLDAFDTLIPHFGPASTLFVDLVRPPGPSSRR